MRTTHMPIFGGRMLSRGRIWLAVALFIAVILSVATRAMGADPGSQYGSIGAYGEVWRGGGFDRCWFDAGAYDGRGAANSVAGCASNESSPAPGKFVDPVGFSVDASPPSDAIYVLDRTTALPGNLTASRDVTSWRLQKLGPTGQVLGSDRFSLPADTPAVENSAANNGTPTDYEITRLTVDPTLGRVYALLVAYNANAPSPNNQEVVDEIISWSTTPNGSGQLGPASGIINRDASDLALGANGDPTPAVLSDRRQLILSPNSSLPFAGQSIMESPTGLAIDATGGSDNVAVQGADATAYGAGAGIVAVSPTSGAMVKNWSSSSFAGVPNDAANEIYQGAGLSTDPKNGNLVWLDDQGSGTGTPANFDVAELPASLPDALPSSPPVILSSLANAVTNGDNSTASLDDAAVSAADVVPQSYDDGSPIAATVTAAPQIVGLSNGLYVGVFEPEPAGRPDPSDPAGLPGSWTPANPALRLLGTDQSGLLSELAPPLGNLFDTLGNTTPNQTGSTSAASACSLSDGVSAAAGADPYPSLGSGAGGAIWVLTNGQDSSGAGQNVAGSGPQAFQGGRQLIELAPNAGSACPTPSGTFSEGVGGVNQPASGPALTVTQGTTVNFDASSIDRHGAAPAAYRWSFGDGNGTTTLDGHGSPFAWPAPTASEHYTAAGTYTVTLTMYSDAGQYVETGMITVIPSTPEMASFTFGPSNPQAGQSVTFDGSGSTPTPGATILEYEWYFGDGRIQTTTSPTTTHSYRGPSSGYPASLTVFDSDGVTSTATSHSVPVTLPDASPSPPSGSTQGTAQQVSNQFTIVSLIGRGHHGSLLVGLHLPDPGTVTVRATYTRRVKVKRKHHKVKLVTKTFAFATAARSLPTGTATLTLNPSAGARSVLRALSARSGLGVGLRVTFTPAGGSAASKNAGVRMAGLKAAKRNKKIKK